MPLKVNFFVGFWINNLDDKVQIYSLVYVADMSMRKTD